MRAKKLRLTGLADSISWEKIDKKRFGVLKNGGLDDKDFGDSIRFSRFYIFNLAVFFILLLFLARLFGLTVIAGDENRALSESNRVRLVQIEAGRGNIYDRNGVLLAYSKRTYFLKKGGQSTEITPAQVVELEKQGLASEDFEGELGEIRQEVKREYTLSDIAAHILGYTSVVQKEDKEKDSNVSLSTSVGRLGVEQAYNDFLVGKAGKKLIEVDAIGKKVSILGEEQPITGRNLHLTIDSKLQKASFDSLTRQLGKIGVKRGAVIIQNPKTGEVLVLVSAPPFNPEDIGKHVADLDKPFFNRAIQGNYPPGSVFKVVSALAGLESGKITPDTEIEDVGEFEVAGTRFSNWYFSQYGKKDGVIKIDKAIARSNDIFFYKLAEKVGLLDLREMAIKLGLGQKTGIDLPGESLGLVPDEVWKKSTFSNDWYLGDTMHLGIGQGFLLVTPIQVNMITSFMASGKLTKPFLVSRIDAPGVDDINLGSKIIGENSVDPKNLEVVRSGMKLACQKGGTGAPFFDASYTVGCKTGTAEKQLGNPHAWFTAFAPYDDPQVAVTVLIEDGGEGSTIAGPVAKEILDWWFGNRLNIKN